MRSEEEQGCDVIKGGDQDIVQMQICEMKQWIFISQAEKILIYENFSSNKPIEICDGNCELKHSKFTFLSCVRPLTVAGLREASAC